MDGKINWGSSAIAEASEAVSKLGEESLEALKQLQQKLDQSDNQMDTYYINCLMAVLLRARAYAAMMRN